MVNSDELKTLAIEILKVKYDLKNSSEEEILNSYSNIYLELKNANKKLKKSDNMTVLK